MKLPSDSFSCKRLLPGLLLAAMLFAPALPRKRPGASSSRRWRRTASTPEAQSPEKNKQEEDENDAYRHSPTVQKLGSDARPERRAGGDGVHRCRTSSCWPSLVGWFLVKTLPKTFRDRNTAIQKHLVDARTATEEASARLSSVEERLSKLDEQIAAMRAQAEKDSARDEQRIKACVEEEKQKILAAAEQEIAAATTQAQRQIQQYAAELAIEQAARKLVVTAETDRLLVQSFARRLTGDDSRKGRTNVRRLPSLRPRLCLRRCRVAAGYRRGQQQLNDFSETLAGSRELREVLMNPSIPDDAEAEGARRDRGAHRHVPAGPQLHRGHHGPSASARAGRDSHRVPRTSPTSNPMLAEAEITSARPLNDQRPRRA